MIFFGGLSPKAPAAACGDAEIRLARGAFDPVYIALSPFEMVLCD